MKRRWIALLLCLTILFLLAGCARRDAQSAEEMPELRIGVSIYSPYFYRDLNGSYAGVDRELAVEACARIGVRPVFCELELNERFPSLASGTVDCLWSCLSMDGREDDYLWAGPYLYTRRVLVVHADSDFQSPSDLSGRRIAVQAHSTSESLLLENPDGDLPRPGQLSAFSTVGEVFTALRKGYVDAIAGPETALRLYTDDYPDQYRSLSMSLHRESLGVAFSLDADAALVERLGQALSDMTEDGTTAAILEKYGLDVSENLYMEED